MKSSFCSSTITIILLVFTGVSNAQINRPIEKKSVPAIFRTETHKKINFKNGIVVPHEWESQKIKKATRRIDLQNEVYNPYQPYNPARIPALYNGSLPYNNDKEKNESILTGAGHILLSILADKTHHQYQN